MIKLEQIFGEIKYDSIVSDFPGCGQLGISHSLISNGSGFGKKANELRQKQMRNIGYNAVLCTIEEGNEKQVAILKATGWTKVASFFNECTEHMVEIWFNPLREKA